MTSQTLNTADELRRMIEQEHVSVDSLQSMTGISADALASSINSAPSGAPGLSTSASTLSPDEAARLSGLVAQLTDGFQIDDDFRLQAILETLVLQFHLTAENLALLTHTKSRDMQSFLDNPESIALETKYQLALRTSYLLAAIGNATARPTA